MKADNCFYSFDVLYRIQQTEGGQVGVHLLDLMDHVLRRVGETVQAAIKCAPLNHIVTS